MVTKILMVCMGNICRSPLAEGILREKATERQINLIVDSAGTFGWHIGEKPDPRSIANAYKNGVDISKSIARKFTATDFDNFDIIYVMDNSNLKNVIAIANNEVEKSKVKLILSEIESNHKEVPDPYYGGEDGFQLVYELLDKACEQIIENLSKQHNG